MTVAELIASLAELDSDDEVPLDLVIDDLSYIEDALQQWCVVAEAMGRPAPPEVSRFLARAQDAL